MVFVHAISAEDHSLTWSMTFRESGYCTFTATMVPLYFNLALCTCGPHTGYWVHYILVQTNNASCYIQLLLSDMLSNIDIATYSYKLPIGHAV